MGKKFLIAAIAALVALPTLAQSEKHYEYDEYGKVGRSEGWARRFAHNFVDGLMGAEYYEVVDENGKKVLSDDDKQDIVDDFSKAIDAYNKYLDRDSEKKDEVNSKIEYLQNEITKYMEN